MHTFNSRRFPHSNRPSDTALRLIFAALLIAILLTAAYLAHAQNPVIGTIQGRPITLDTIQDGQIYKLRVDLNRVFRERMQGYALSELAKTYPEYAFQPVTVTDEELNAAYQLGGSAYGTLESLKPKLRQWVAASKATKQLNDLWAKALAAGLVTDNLTPPAVFQPTIPIARERVEGNARADVLLIEFADFQCPYCRQAAPTVAQVREQFGDRIAFLHVHFPLDMHTTAFEAAVAAECARQQGKFGPYSADLYAADPNKQRAKDFIALAAKHRLKQDTFAACLDNPAVKDLVNKDIEQGRWIGVTGTPTFVAARWDHRTDTASGEAITGAVDADTLSAALNKALAQQ